LRDYATNTEQDVQVCQQATKRFAIELFFEGQVQIGDFIPLECLSSQMQAYWRYMNDMKRGIVGYRRYESHIARTKGGKGRSAFHLEMLAIGWSFTRLLIDMYCYPTSQSRQHHYHEVNRQDNATAKFGN
jgi:hypothetical protein